MVRWRAGFVVLASSLLLGCPVKETTAAPTCPEIAVVNATPTTISVEPPPAAAVSEEVEPKEETPDGIVATHDLGSVAVTVRVRENDSDDEELPEGRLWIEITRDGVATVDVVARDIDAGGCFVEELEFYVDMIFSDGETLVFETSYRCVVGEDVVRIEIEHLLLAAFAHGPGLSVLHEGTSRYINNRGLAVELDKREFHVEMGNVAVYRHTVAWCDDEGMKVQFGEDAGCGRASPRKLKLLERVPIGVSVSGDD